jgi:hypothetical protein
MTLDGYLAQLADALGRLSTGTSWRMMLALVAVGTFSMASLEVFKALTPVRERYQEKWFGKWLTVRANSLDSQIIQCLNKTSTVIAQEAIGQLVELATGGDNAALYSMWPEAMEPQMVLASQIAVDDPSRYASLVAVLSAGISVADLTAVSNPDGTPAYMAARERAMRRIMRNLDGARLSLGNRWKLLMQLTSIGTTVLIVELAVAFGPSPHCVTEYLLALPIGVVGGYFAPITRDLLAALQQLRSP